jgi:hypothetical protein
LIVAENEREMLGVGAIGAGGDVMEEKARFLVECAIKDGRSWKSDPGRKLGEPNGGE